MPDPHDRPPTNSDRADEEDSSSHSAMPGLDSDQLFNAVCRSLSFRSKHLLRNYIGIENFLTQLFPDLSRRKSLRKVHRRTVDIAQKLNLIADSAYECQDWSMAGAVVRFWVTICADAALGRALLQQGEWFDELTFQILTGVLVRQVYCIELCGSSIVTCVVPC